MLTPRQDSCHHVGTQTHNTDRENRLIDAHPIIGFMAMLAFIMGHPPPELVTALGPAALSDTLSLPLLLRLRDSLTCRLCQLSDCNVTYRIQNHMMQTPAVQWRKRESKTTKETFCFGYVTL